MTDQENRPEFLEFASIPEFVAIEELEQRKLDLENQIDEDTFPAVAEILGDAANVLAEEARALARSEGFQQQVASLGMKALKNSQKLDEARAFTPDTDKIDELSSGLEAVARKAAGFFENYGAVAEDAQKFMNVVAAGGIVAVDQERIKNEPSEVKPDRTAETSGERTKIPLQLTFRKKGVKLGKRRGRTIKYCQYNAEGTRDYTEARKKVFLFLAENPDKEANKQDLIDLIEADSDEKIGHNEWAHVRKWLLDLNFRGKDVVKMHGKNKATYAIAPYFEVSILREDEPTSTDTDITSPLSGAEASAIEAEEGENEDKEATAMYVVASQLSRFNKEFATLGRPIVSDEMLRLLEPFKPNHSHLCGNDEAIEAKRKEALDSVSSLLVDEKRFLQFIESITQADPLSKFTEEFLLAFDDEQGRDLLNLLINARRTHEVEISFSKVPSAGIVRLIEKGIIGPEGVSISLPLAEQPTNFPETERGAEEVVVEHVDLMDQDLSPVDVTSPQPARKERRKNESKRRKFDEIKELIETSALRWLSCFHPDESHLSGHVASALGGRVGKISGRQEIALEDYIQIYLKGHKKLGPSFSARANKKIVSRIVASVLSRARDGSLLQEHQA